MLSSIHTHSTFVGDRWTSRRKHAHASCLVVIIKKVRPATLNGYLRFAALLITDLLQHGYKSLFRHLQAFRHNTACGQTLSRSQGDRVSSPNTFSTGRLHVLEYHCWKMQLTLPIGPMHRNKLVKDWTILSSRTQSHGLHQNP